MQLEPPRPVLEPPDAARALLSGCRLRDPERGWRNLAGIAAALGPPGLRDLGPLLGRLLPRCPDADMALNNLERFFAAPDGPARLPSLLENRGRTLEILLQLFSVSQSFSDLLTADPGSIDMLRVPLRRSPSPAEMQAQLQAEVDAAYEDSAVLRVFRRFRRRQLLRIGANDVIRDRPLEEITRDIARTADVALEVALAVAQRHVGKRCGQPCTAAGRPVSCAVLAFGKHGGEELNYSSDIDLMFIYEEEGATRGKRISSIGNDEYFSKVVGEVVRLLSAHADGGLAYRVDLRLRPEGHRGPLARSLASTLSYYDSLGRTWERQALIKARPAAGDLALGQRFLQAVEPFVYRKYLTFAEINEIKALKRRIEKKAQRSGAGAAEVKTGRGGIRDIEFTIQFLQLLNGGDLPEVRQRNTLLALQALERAGCLTDQEYRVLDDAYRFLRKTEHRLQLLFDLQTHRLPEGDDELRKLALRMGYPPRSDGVPEPRLAFLADYRDKTEPTRRILDHLLHQTFAGEAGGAEPESDLILDTQPDPETIRSVLGRYPFRDVQGAYNNLVQLAQESSLFLSTHRCRHFLASIAPALLGAVADTPDPDMALLNLEKVTGSLGAKTVLWELFSFNPPSLKLYVDLCAWSQFLSELLVNNPGMIDELLDSLVLNQPRSGAELRQELTDLCRGASDLEPILHSFQDKELLRIGVRDILGKDRIRATTAELSDLAETILVELATRQAAPLEKRFGLPCLTEGEAAGRRSRFVMLALGKLGGRELNYHSDLDLMLIYEGDGRTSRPPAATRFDRYESTDNFHYFTELAQRIIRAASYLGPMGRLYQIDMRLRPTGKSGSLVLPLGEFRRYFAGDGKPQGGAQLWERQALTRARVVHGDADFGAEVMAAAAEAACALPWRPELADEIVAMRERLQSSRGPRDLKRGPGGVVDVEFLVQLFQLKYGRERPDLRRPNTWEALEALRSAGLLSEEEHAALRDGYDFVRRVQSRLRIVHNRSVDEVPEAPEVVEKLARRLGYESADRFRADLEKHTQQIRDLFLRLVARERGAPKD
ncbi:MAG TPA: bifunctional [glutamate--ammonia ligase]-adenylyl-L-tyrosine phosphorylase/[glutamate--ammonia-ligase] adenylyltransferase [Gemmataceae bacterium]|nr:bifunctional [glutamate--ammonia ligase]-adenylyl-L-tyrosine phosphorylase/[glutamate--ammonia-ligase] adenylyltransferase [Gemmataceae bacterium]